MPRTQGTCIPFGGERQFTEHPKSEIEGSEENVRAGGISNRSCVFVDNHEDIPGYRCILCDPVSREERTAV
jgi:hypothetical protein